MGRRTWIKIYCDNWLRGTLREETAELRGIWTDILTLAGDSTYGDEGYIKLANNVGYTDEQIASILQLKDVITWEKTKKILKETDRISILEGNVIRIVNWRKYQSEYMRQKPQRIAKKSATKSATKSLPEKREERREKRDIDKKKYMDFVLLTEKEFIKLVNKYGASTTKQYIQKLNIYIGSKGRRYKSHYFTILNWLNKDNIRSMPKKAEVKLERPDSKEQEKVAALIHQTAKELNANK